MLRLISRWSPSQNRRLREYNVVKCKACKHKPIAVKYDDPGFDKPVSGTFQVFCVYCGTMRSRPWFELGDAAREWNDTNE